MKILLFLPLAFFMSVPIHAQDCANFDPGTHNFTSLKNEFEGAVFRIAAGASVGTAYLLDFPGGYLVSAWHVVEGALTDSNLKIKVTGPAVVGELEAEIVKPDPRPDVDLVLLRLKHPPAVAHIRGIDLRLSPLPEADTPLVGFGYPIHPNEPTSVLTLQKADFRNANQFIEVSRPTFGGDSGGPLLFNSGDSAGTCHQEVGELASDANEDNGHGGVLARYSPNLVGKDLLDVLPVTNRALELDKRLREGKIKYDELVYALTKRSGGISNLELASWMSLVSQADGGAYSKSSNLIDCPLIRAFNQRGLAPVARGWYKYVSSVGDRNRADMAVAAAEENRLTGRFDPAMTETTEAASLYRKVGDLENFTRATLLTGRLFDRLGFVDEAETILAEAANAAAKLKNAALSSTTLASLGAVRSELGQDTNSRAALREAVDANPQKTADAAFEYARLSFKIGDTAAAMKNLQTVLSGTSGTEYFNTALQLSAAPPSILARQSLNICVLQVPSQASLNLADFYYEDYGKDLPRCFDSETVSDWVRKKDRTLFSVAVVPSSYDFSKGLPLGQRLVPGALDAVVPVYALPEGVQLRLSHDILVSIFTGKVRYWDDRALQEANRSVKLPHLAIVPAISDRDPIVSAVFSNYLAPSRQADPVKKMLSVGQAGPPIDLTKLLPGTISYASRSEAVRANVRFAALLNAAGNYVKASESTIQAASRGAGDLDLWESYGRRITSTRPESYPMTFARPIEINFVNSDEGRLLAGAFVRWIVTSGQRASYASGFVPVSPDIGHFATPERETIQAQSSRQRFVRHSQPSGLNRKRLAILDFDASSVHRDSAAASAGMLISARASPTS